MVVSGPLLPRMIRELGGVEPPAAAADEADLVYLLSIPSFGRTRLVRFGF